jgi:hypothetical protein
VYRVSVVPSLARAVTVNEDGVPAVTGVVVEIEKCVAGDVRMPQTLALSSAPAPTTVLQIVGPLAFVATLLWKVGAVPV